MTKEGAVETRRSQGSMSEEVSKQNRNEDRGFSLRRIFSRSRTYKGDNSSDKFTRKNSSDSLAVCPVCYAMRSKSLFPEISTCEHRSCLECLRQYMTIEINESRVNLTCPECSERFHPNDIKLILNNDVLMAKYDEFTLRRILVADPDCRWCPAPDCGYAVIASGCASCPKLQCERPGCNTEFCYHCKQIWHPNLTCDSARMRRATHIKSITGSEGCNSNGSDDMKPCPRCGAFIIKMDDGSCNHMTCAVCGAEFCWLCMKEISDLHYLSPSGCTFWGKKPWSRKKKILWQMGTLIGAPLGIALAAGVVLPAMIIGIPVYVGRQVHDKYNKPYKSRRKRNAAISGAVTLSILASPILAALTVGVGVPIALGYIYGVVPVSLCRSGGCATVTNIRNGKGVILDFDEDGDPSVATPGTAGAFGTSQSSSRSSMRGTDKGSTTGVVTVVATVNTGTETESGKQPSISMSQDCSSLDSSTIGPRGGGDGDSHASLIPGPRSCTVSIASSFDNFNVSTCEGLAATPSITEAMAMDDIFDRTSVTNVSHHGSNIDKDSLSVLESVGSNEDD